ncbi:MAG: glucose-1-phosphate adenylyltransferase [Candidatus Aminicenantes bacterium]|nr:MAG: glucose-1-phosphate adenylyltransferase [Candidatus Aminicenantes bacterium]
MTNVLAVILGGGQGTRLYPLTKFRAKPAVPIGGKFRLIDIPMSNCIHWDIRKIYVLTQFNSVSLHKHIFNTYKFDHFSRGFVQVLSAQQTLQSRHWYQGTADAVRKNINFIQNQKVDVVVVLSGDQLFRFNLRDFVNFHQEKNAEITIASTPVSRESTSGFGILKINKERKIIDFKEKPKKEETLDKLEIPTELMNKDGRETLNHPFLASMGIYIFNKDVLIDLLETNQDEDFGKQIIPASIQTHHVYTYVFSGYWEDIGTIKAFFEANLDFANPVSKFNFYDEHYPIYTNARFLPGSKIKNCEINRALICEGSVLEGSKISDAVIGLRSIIKEGSTLDHVVMMGADFYGDAPTVDTSKMGVGKNCFIRNAILDKNVRVGDNVIIDYNGLEKEIETELYHIIDGIVVVPKNSYIPANTRIE